MPSAKTIAAIVANVWGEYAGGICRGMELPDDDYDEQQQQQQEGGAAAASSSSSSSSRGGESGSDSGGGGGGGGMKRGFGSDVGTFGEGDLNVLLLELEYAQLGV